jgi:serine protease Do
MQFRKPTIVIAAAGLFAVGAASGFALPQQLRTAFSGAPNATTETAPAAPVPKGPIPLGTAPDYRAIVAQNSPAVVGITTESVTQVSSPWGQDGSGNSPFGNDPFFQFFREIPAPHGDVHTRALGSGFIISPDGLILTNAHVVRDAKRVTVKLADRREFKAKVLGIDTATDIAVLKIDAHNLPTVRVGDSKQLQVGDYVLAIGQPYGFEESATAGIVSAKGRSLPGDSYVPFIQTDVAVNPGNSGGPLFDSSGAVVGINSQIYTNTGGFEGVSFAIPIDLAMHIKDQIAAHGKVEHARLGVEIQPLNPSLAASFDLNNPNGALVAKVEPDSAAAHAGLQSGDVILKYDGEPVHDAGDLSAKVGLASPGDTVKLDVWRNGKPITVKVQLGNATQVASAGGNTPGAGHGRLGLAVRPLTPDERQQIGVSVGLLVENASGPAADAGIQPGDVVLSVDGTPVRTAEQMRNIVRKHDKQVALLIQRGDARIFVPVVLG